MPAPRRLRLSAAAEADIVNLLRWTEEHFGAVPRDRYQRVLSAALADLLADPERPGSQFRDELGDGARLYHLRHSRRRAEVARPRHVLLYRIEADGNLAVARVLHDAMDPARHAGGDPFAA